MSDVFLTPQQIYEKLTGGPGSGSLGDAQRISYDEASRESERAERITRIGRTIQGGWQGNAADEAYGAAAPLADAALRGADDLYRSQDLLDRQSGSFQRAANSVVPVSDDLPEMDVGDFMNPVDYEQEVRRYQADAEHNMQVFEGYDNASSHNETYAPREYPIINHSGGTVSVTAGDTVGGGGPESGGDSPRNGGDTGGAVGPSGGAPNGGGAPGGGPSGGSLPGGTPSPGPGGGQQTRPNDYVPPVSPPAGYQPPVSQPGPSTGTTGGLSAGFPVGGYPGGGSGGGLGAGGGAGPEEMFGSEVLTAPQVIGDDEYEED